MEVKWAQFAKVVLEILVSITRFMSILYVKRCRLLCSSYSHFIIPCLACYELAAKVSAQVQIDPNPNSEPGSVGDISGSCTSGYGKHQVPFAF